MAETTPTTPKSEEQPGYERPRPNVQAHGLSALNDSTPSGEAANMDLLLDVSVPIVAQLGGAELRIRELLKLAPGSIVELDKLAGEPVDLYVRGQLFAQGEVVVVDENFGVRISRVTSQKERAESAAGA